MLDRLIEKGLGALQWDIRLTTLVAFLSVFALTRLVTTIQFYVMKSQTGVGKSPAVVPYSVPILGSLIPFGADSYTFVTNAV